MLSFLCGNVRKPSYNIHVEKNCWIYSLHDPNTDELRYVGETKLTPEERRQGHIRYQASEVMSDWINELKEQGKEPLQKIIEQCECHRRHKLEEYHIKINASERLLNTIHNPYRDKGMRYEDKVLILERRIKKLESTSYNDLEIKYNQTKKQLNEVIDERDKYHNKYKQLIDNYNNMAQFANDELDRLRDEINKLRYLEKLYPVKKYQK